VAHDSGNVDKALNYLRKIKDGVKKLKDSSYGRNCPSYTASICNSPCVKMIKLVRTKK